MDRRDQIPIEIREAALTELEKSAVVPSRVNGTSRREFLRQWAAPVSACLSPELARAVVSSGPNVQFPTSPRERVAVAAYPFRDYLMGWKGWDGKSPSSVPRERQIELKDFAAHVAEKFDVHRIEPWSPIFPSTDPKYLDEFRASAEKAGSAIVNIAVDESLSEYSLDPAERKKSVISAKLWVDVGAALASPSIRIGINGPKGSKPDVALTADTVSRVAEYAAKKNVVVHLENDDPVREDPFFIVQVLGKVNSPWLRALPDFGNSLVAHDEDFAYRAIDAMFAHSYGICHVKNGEESDAGKFVSVDLARTFAILKTNGYKGYCSIEYDAPGDPYKPTAELVEQTIKFLS